MKDCRIVWFTSIALALGLLAGCGKPRQRQTITLADLETTNPPVAATLTRLGPAPLSTVRIDGTSNIHDWQVEGSPIGGYFEFGPGFPIEPGQAVSPGKIEARAEAFIVAQSLRSIEKNGKPYSDMMDGIMYEKLKAKDDPKARITYRLTDLVLKEAAKSPEAPYLFDSKGELVVAGVTNKVSMPVTILPLGQMKLRITGSVSVKMTAFNIEPPSPSGSFGLIKTGDDVKLSFQWLLKPPTTAAAK
jgi:hypothetical protein